MHDLVHATGGRGVGYVLAASPKTIPITTGVGVRTAIDLTVRPPPRSWQQISTRAGSKDHTNPTSHHPPASHP